VVFEKFNDTLSKKGCLVPMFYVFYGEKYCWWWVV